MPILIKFVFILIIISIFIVFPSKATKANIIVFDPYGKGLNGGGKSKSIKVDTEGSTKPTLVFVPPQGRHDNQINKSDKSKQLNYEASYMSPMFMSIPPLPWNNFNAFNPSQFGTINGQPINFNPAQNYNTLP